MLPKPQRTADGLRLKNVAKALEKLSFVTVRRESNNPYIAFRAAYPVPCPITVDTDARKVIVPWVRNATGYKNTERLYKALKCGGWN
ncbi:Uncharacterised protein [uncultured archaeon]|nr:Uncharacterised protein [uncultured archaeon]